MRHRGRGGPGVSGRDGVWLPTGEEAAAFDTASHAIVPERVMMENAGRAAAAIIQKLHPHGRILGYAGSGHNGGDLLVALRTLHCQGRDVSIITTGSRPVDTSLLNGHTLELHSFSGSDAIAHDVIVDGILGTGVRDAPRGNAAAAIAAINASGRPVIALDLPSGVNASDGNIPGDVVNAETTITFGWPKLGLLLYPGRAHCGRIIATEIGFPPATGFDAEAITPGWAIARTPRREPDAHKGSSGRLLILAGQNGMAGAALIATEAAVRSGAGLVRIASDAANRALLQVGVPEAMFVDRAALSTDDVARATAVVAGPGIGQDAAARRALDIILDASIDVPTLLDADALNMLAQDPSALHAAANRPLLLTPHPLELARLLGADVADVTRDRVAAAREAARTFGCVVLAKGQPSIVADPDGGVLVNTAVTSDVAAAGMGDQLAGVAGGFLAAGSDPRTAAGLALYYGGRAAQLARRGRALSPRDVTGALATAFADPGDVACSLGIPGITFDQHSPA
ncbi:MAG TPA: NAD(P)H-hydrate dehydratase [Longimicrobiales bacterium]